MVRAIKKPGNTATITREYYCNHCGDWYDSEEFTCATGYSVQNHIGEYEGDDYYEDYTSWEVWTCDACNEIISLDQPPQTRESEGGVWVCGECKDEYDDQEDARYCCD